MRKVIYMFLPVICGLILCTFLSLWIEEQMTAQVIVAESNNDGILELPYSSLETDETGVHLYKEIKGSGWNSGTYLEEVAPEDYQIVDGKVIISGSFEKYIVYASKPVMQGTHIRAISQIAGKTENYLIKGMGEIPENGLNEKENMWDKVTILAENQDAMMISYQGQSPFIEKQLKDELNLSENVRIWHLEDIRSLGKSFPQISILLAISIIMIFLWIGSWSSIKNCKNNKFWISFYSGSVLVLLVIFQKITEKLALPSSFLPRQNIFELSYYQKELTEVFQALRQLQSTEALSVIQEFSQNSIISIIMIGIGAVAGVLLLVGRKWYRKRGGGMYEEKK